jgi:hypothetical protein
MPALLDEVEHMTHNIFHVDGKGVARHLVSAGRARRCRLARSVRSPARAELPLSSPGAPSLRK